MVGGRALLPFRAVGVFSGSGRNGPLFRDLQDRVDELADILQARTGVEASAARVAHEELEAIREDGYGMGAERQVHSHAGVGADYRHSLWGFPRVIAHCGFTWTCCCGRKWRCISARAETTLFQVRAHVPFSSSSGHGNGRRLL
jgi:hypothetical protein